MRLVVFVVLLSLFACAGPRGRRMTPDEMERYEASARPTPAPNAGVALAPSQPSLAARELGSRRVELTAELEALRARGEDLALKHDLEQRGEALALRHAERRLARAQRERTLHDEIVVPLRMREADLEIEECAARRRAAEEELAAMQELWAEAEQADSATAAELLARAREELARVSQAHDLALLRRRELVERTLPAALEARVEELANAEWALEDARLAQRLGAARREREVAALTEERRALDKALASIESESARLGREGGLLRGVGG